MKKPVAQVEEVNYIKELAKFEACTPPYSSSQISICAPAAKTILLYTNKKRRYKYDFN